MDDEKADFRKIDTIYICIVQAVFIVFIQNITSKESYDLGSDNEN